MKEEGERRGVASFGPWLQVTLLLALAAGNLLRVAPFEADRPGGHPEMLPPGRASRIQAIPTRFWEDPLAAVHLADSGARDSKEGGPILVHSVAREAGEKIGKHVREIVSGSDPIQVGAVLVLVPGGPYAEDHETRLRTRHALQTAFLAEGFQSFDSRRIGGVWIPREGSAGNPPSPGNGGSPEREPMLVAYELYSKGARAVLVLWVDEEQVVDAFRGRLREIEIDLLGHVPTGDKKPGEGQGNAADASEPQAKDPPVSWPIRIVGPSNSDDLARIVPALEMKALPRKRSARGRMLDSTGSNYQIYSPWATAVEE
ncbi:MAG: hypothetical protein ACREIU_04255, partial [Planctomycetota bacterium]